MLQPGPSFFGFLHGREQLLMTMMEQQLNPKEVEAWREGARDVITGVDPGSLNCGIAKYSVSRDRFLFLGLADLRTSRAGNIVDTLHEYRTRVEPASFSHTDLVAVERQMGNNARNMCVETTLRAEWRGRCVCVPPQVIMDHFGVPRGTPRPEKKKAMVSLMRELLTTRETAMVESAVEVRRAENRKLRKEYREEQQRRKASGKKRKRGAKKPSLKRIKYDDVLEAAAQALWAAEQLMGHKVGRRRKKRRKKRQATITDVWPASSRRQEEDRDASVVCIIVIDDDDD